MLFRALGETGLKVSVVGLGCWAMGKLWWGQTDDNDSIAAIHAALECGINFIDTAAVYGFGHSERLVGSALRDRRGKAIIATKCGFSWDRPEVSRSRFDSSEKSMIASCEQSLKNLQTDVIDLFQAHFPDPQTPPEEVIATFLKLREQGKIRYFGLSNYSSEKMARAFKKAPFSSLQSKLSLLTQDVMDGEVPFCTQNNIGFLAYSPMEMGLLTGKYDSRPKFQGPDWRGHNPHFKGEKFNRALEVVKELRRIAGSYGRTPGQAAANWVIHAPGVTCALIGAKNSNQVFENSLAGNWQMNKDDWEQLRRLGRGVAASNPA